MNRYTVRTKDGYKETFIADSYDIRGSGAIQFYVNAKCVGAVARDELVSMHIYTEPEAPAEDGKGAGTSDD